jgi:FkbM family methyltransferase
MKKIIWALKKRFATQSFALNELDRKLAKFIRFRNGFFIEAGANNGIDQSNSLYFEKYLGWKGLLIEAIPSLAEQCKRNRSYCLVENCALVSSSYQSSTIEMQYNDLMSIVKGSFNSETDEKDYIETGHKFLRQGDSSYLVSVPAKTLSSVLNSHGIERIDLLSLDVEGYEVEVLGGIDFENHSPRYILVEVWHNKKQTIESMLSPYYEELAVLNTNSMFSDVLYHLR